MILVSVLLTAHHTFLSLILQSLDVGGMTVGSALALGFSRLLDHGVDRA